MASDPGLPPEVAFDLGSLFELFLAGRPRPLERIELRPTLASRIAVALVVLAAAIVVPLPGEVGLVAAGVAACVVLGRRRVVIDATGIQARGLVGTASLPWAEIGHYFYWSSSAYGVRWEHRDGVDPATAAPSTIRGRAAIAMRHTLVVVGRSGARIVIDSRYHHAEHAVAVVVDELHDRLAATTDFAPFTIADDGLHHVSAGMLPWKQVDTIVVDGQTPARLHVQARRKSFPWRTEKTSRVRNHLLLVERLAERGVPIELSSDVLVHDRLSALLARMRAVPRARVVTRDAD